MSGLRNSLLLLLAFALAAWGWYTAGLKAQRDRLAADLAASEQEAAAWQRELRLSRRALEEREAARQQLAEEKAAAINTLREVYANDENARAWADAPCPDAVLDCLLGETLPADAAAPAPGGVSGGH